MHMASDTSQIYLVTLVSSKYNLIIANSTSGAPISRFMLKNSMDNFRPIVLGTTVYLYYETSTGVYSS